LGKIKSKYLKDTEIQDCVNSAYTDLQILLHDAFIKVSELPNQLTLNELYSLFECYDWQDIFNILEELENCTDFTKIESVYSTLIGSLKSDNNFKPLTNPRENTFYKVWKGLMTDQDF
jgi:hypothetical protein